MRPGTNSSLLAQFRLAQRVAGVLVAWPGMLGLTGWLLDVERLRSVLPGSPAMVPGTACCLLLAGIVLALWRADGPVWQRHLVRGAGVVLIGIGVMVVTLNYLAEYPHPLDALLAPGWLFGTVPTRMATNTACCFILAGTAFRLLDGRRWARLGQWLALGVGVVSFVVLTGYLFGLPAMTSFSATRGMAVHTALAFLFLSVGLLCARADTGMMSLMASAGPGGTMLRVLLPLLLLSRFALHGLIEAGSRAGLYGHAWADPLLAVASMAVTIALVLLAARWLERSYRERVAAESRFTRAFNLSPMALTITRMADGQLVEVNETFLRRTGYIRDEVIGRTPLEVGLWVDPQQRAAQGERLRQGGIVQDEEARFRIRDGTEIICQISASQIEFGGQPCILSVVSDITARKQAEAQLRESESRFRQLAEAVPQFVFVTEADGRLSYVNQQWLDFSGLTLEQTGDPAMMAAIWHPEDGDRMNEAWQTAFNKASQLEVEGRMKNRQGAYHWFLIRAVPVRDESGKLHRWFGTSTDITERKQAEEQIRTANYRFSIAEEAARGFSYEWNLDTDTVTRSASLQNVLGYEPGELADTWEAWTALMHPDDLIMTKAQSVAFLNQFTDERSGYEYRVRHKNGHYCWLYERAMLLRDEAGRVQRVIGQTVDITERKEAEQKLRYQLQLTQNITDTAAVAIFVSGADGNISFINPEAEKIFGYTLSELTGRSLHEILHYQHPDGRPFPIAECPLGRVYEDGRAVRDYESVFYRRDGTPVWVICSSMPIIEQGRVTGEVMTMQDISERKQLEAEREQLLVREQQARALAETASRAKDEFLAIVTHELRSPLNAILGYARLLNLRRAELQPEFSEFIEVVRRNGERQNELINDLLDTARITTGKLRLEIAPVSLAAVIRDVLAALQPSASSRNLRLRADIELSFSDGRDTLPGDAARLQQVVWNLLTNAIKFTPPGGRVEISLRRAPQQVVLTVSDTGQGISPEFLPHIFERFSQQDASRSRRHGGLGLGLALARQIVELHGGTITASSAGAGKGATFIVSLPVRTAAITTGNETQQAESAPDKPAASLPPSTILRGVTALIVTADEATCALLLSLLSGQGAEAQSAANTAAAWPVVTAGMRPDLIICDTELSEEDGFSLLRRLRQWEHEHDAHPLPAIALTAHNRATDRMQALVAGFQTHLARPVEPEELITVIRSLLDRASLTESTTAP